MDPQNKITNQVISANLKNVFKKAKRNQRGDLVLRHSRFIRLAVILLFLIFAGGTVVMFYSGSSLEVLAALGILTVALGLWGLGLIFSRIVVSDHMITSYQWSGKKRLNLYELTEIKHSQLWGGSIVLHSRHGNLLVPTDYAGTAEFVQILKEKLGEEFCSEASFAIFLRKKEMNSRRSY